MVMPLRTPAKARVAPKGAQTTQELRVTTKSSALSTDEPPYRAHGRGMDLSGEVHHAFEAGEGYLALVVVVAEPEAQLIGYRPLLDPSYEELGPRLSHDARELGRVRVVDDDRF